jgi:transcriptional regulator with XRE-family HTH domain
MTTPTFGTAISIARRSKGYSQKELAERIRMADDAGNQKSISPQYLNDIEHDRRSPSSTQLINQFAVVLELNEEYLVFLADRWPSSWRDKVKSVEDFENLSTAFRRQGVAH